jgi:hypothetical protein
VGSRAGGHAGRRTIAYSYITCGPGPFEVGVVNTATGHAKAWTSPDSDNASQFPWAMRSRCRLTAGGSWGNRSRHAFRASDCCGPVPGPAPTGSLFGPAIVRWYPVVQWFDGDGFADLLRSTSIYRRLESDVREPLLDAIAERIRTRMGDRVRRRYLSVLRVGQRAG